MHQLFKKIESYSRTNPLPILLVAALILFIRKTDSLVNPQFWAEDGAIFFIQQYNLGASAIFQQYAGYFHLAPRLIAFFAGSFFPYSAIPWVYNYSCLLITLLVIANIFSSRLLIENKVLFALAIVTVPHFTNEVFLNITNLQWILSLSIVILLLKEIPQNRQDKIYSNLFTDLLILILCGLTGPFIIFLSPFFIINFIKRRGLYSFTILLVALTISFTQIYSIITNPVLDPIPQESYVKPTINTIIEFFGYRVFGNLFLGVDIAYKVSPYFLFFTFIGFILFLFYLSFPNKRKFYLINIILGFSFIIMLTAAYKFKSNLSILIPAGASPRYLYIPYVMFAWSLIICIRNKGKIRNFLIYLLLSTILISSLISHFNSASFVDFNWTHYSKMIGKAEKLDIPINPPGWYIKILRKNITNSQ